MKLSTELQQIHDSGDCGRAVEGFAAKAKNLEQDISNGVVFLKAAAHERDHLKRAYAASQKQHEARTRYIKHLKSERDQLKLQCITLVEELAEMKDAEQADTERMNFLEEWGVEIVAGHNTLITRKEVDVDLNAFYPKPAEQADALHEIHKEEMGCSHSWVDESFVNCPKRGKILYSKYCSKCGKHEVHPEFSLKDECLRTNPEQVGKVRCSDD